MNEWIFISPINMVAIKKQTEKTIYKTVDKKNTEDKKHTKHTLHARHWKHVTYNRIVDILTPV